MRQKGTQDHVIRTNMSPKSGPRRSEDHSEIETAIDFESLERLVDLGTDDDSEDYWIHGTFHDLRSHDSATFSGTEMGRKSPPYSQQITFYSSVSNSTRRSSSFKGAFPSATALQQILSQHSSSSVWWMDVQNPSESTLRLVCSAFGVHPLTVEDISMRESHEKVEYFPAYYFACLRSFESSQTETEALYKPYIIYVLVFQEGTLTFSFSENVHSTHVLDRIAVLQDYMSINRNWIFYAFVDDIVDSFAAPVARIDGEISEIDDQIYTTRIEDMREFMTRVETLRRNVSNLMPLLSTKMNILKAFNKHHSKLSSCEEISPLDDINLYIGDVRDHVVTMISSLKHFESLLSRAEKNCLAQLEINNDYGRRRVVKFMGRVTLITVILSVLNLICGLFSTNVNSNTTLYATNSLTAWAVIVSMETVLAVCLFFLAKRYKFF